MFFYEIKNCINTSKLDLGYYNTIQNGFHSLKQQLYQFRVIRLEDNNNSKTTTKNNSNYLAPSSNGTSNNSNFPAETITTSLITNENLDSQLFNITPTKISQSQSD
ncbi:hypothetical protein ACTFIU_009485 [Dictyostelium citrinum]